MTAMLHQWVYVSEASFQEHEAEKMLKNIVETSQDRNSILAITGALIFTGRRFAQMIEGELTQVSDLQRSIFSDDRHRNVTTVYFQSMSKRNFSNWTLRYSGISHFLANILDAVELGAPYQRDPVRRNLALVFSEFAD